MNRNVEEGCGRMWKDKADFGWIQPSSNIKYPVKRQWSQTNFASNGYLERFYPCIPVSLDPIK